MRITFSMISSGVTMPKFAIGSFNSGLRHRSFSSISVEVSVGCS